MTLADLFFWTGANNNTGFPNITGTELAALLAGGGVTGQIGLGASVEQNGFQTLPQAARTPINFALSGPAQVDYDDLGFYTDSSPTIFTIPDVDPPIERVVLQETVIFLDASVTQTPSQTRSVQMTLNGLVTTQRAALPWAELPPVVVSNPTTRIAIASGAIEVNAGDVIEFTAAAREPAGNVPVNGFGNLYVVK